MALFTEADDVLDVEARVGFFLAELRRDAAQHERDAGELLAETIVQVAADALLLAVGDVDDAALEPLLFRDVVDHGDPVIRAAHAERRDDAGGDEARAVLAHALHLDRRRAARMALLAEQPLELLALMPGTAMSGSTERPMSSPLRYPNSRSKVGLVRRTIIVPASTEHDAFAHRLDDARLGAQGVALGALLRHFRDVHDGAEHAIAGLHGTDAHLQAAQLVGGVREHLLEVFRGAGVDHALEDVVHTGAILRRSEVLHRRAQPRIGRQPGDGSIQEHAFAVADRTAPARRRSSPPPSAGCCGIRGARFQPVCFR